MQASVQETFKEISQVQENNSCFECGVPNCQWVSVNNGIFLCLGCSNVHRGFGPSVSLIRSIALDSWSDEQLALMKNGGNAALWACFRNFEIPLDRPIDYKFRTKAGVYYREMLKAISQEQPVPEAPSKEEAAELAPIYQVSSTGEEKKKLFQDGTILEKITVESVAQGASELGTSMVQGAKTIANKINDPNLTNEVVEFGASVGEKTYIAVEQSIEKTKEAWANRDELMTKVSDAAVQGWETTVKSTLGFWKKITGKKDKEKGQEQENTQQGTNQGEIIQIQPEPSVQQEIPAQEEGVKPQEEEQKQ